MVALDAGKGLVKVELQEVLRRGAEGRIRRRGSRRRAGGGCGPRGKRHLKVKLEEEHEELTAPVAGGGSVKEELEEAEVEQKVELEVEEGAGVPAK
eukprot:11209362-Alexandrium_andersonii.AAC.1